MGNETSSIFNDPFDPGSIAGRSGERTVAGDDHRLQRFGEGDGDGVALVDPTCLQSETGCQPASQGRAELREHPLDPILLHGRQRFAIANPAETVRTCTSGPGCGRRGLRRDMSGSRGERQW
jgi:hypothetical protein